jgi:hypothetical protein
LLRHNLESQTTALTAKFTNIAEVINDNPKYFEKNAIESLLVDTVLENFFENITSGNLDSYGSISTSRLQKDTLRSAFTSQGIS